MRVAFIDTNFSWPANGGADVDLFQVLCGLQEAGVEVKLFGLHQKGSLERGRFTPEELPFPASRMLVGVRGLAPKRLLAKLKPEVDAWQPDIVWLSHSFALKPALIEAFGEYPLVSRYYAHELACARDPFRYKDGQPCPYDFLRTPEVCRRCAADSLRPEIVAGRHSTWTSDYLAAEAFAPEYHARTLSTLRQLKCIVVSNTEMREHLRGLHDHVVVIGGGVHVRAIQPPTRPPRPAGQPMVILMTGRVEDPRKGLEVLLEAGERLAQQRNDFEIWATHFDTTQSRDWFKATGWLESAEVQDLYRRADIAVVPSLWDEPFGLVAVEAMAWELPVCAANVGGLRDIIRHGKSGLLFNRRDPSALAVHLNALLDSHRLRRELGCAGRKQIETAYNWHNIINHQYIPLLEQLDH
jgi:glycosyltransferase involved in cell wall biosynthesis